MHTRTLAELAAALRDGEFSSAELVGHYLDRIETLDARLNAFVTVVMINPDLSPASFNANFYS